MVWSKMTIFSINQPFLDESFSSSNSTEILVIVKSYRVHGRPDTLTDSRVYSLFEHTKNEGAAYTKKSNKRVYQRVNVHE